MKRSQVSTEKVGTCGSSKAQKQREGPVLGNSGRSACPGSTRPVDLPTPSAGRFGQRGMRHVRTFDTGRTTGGEQVSGSDSLQQSSTPPT